MRRPGAEDGHVGAAGHQPDDLVDGARDPPRRLERLANKWRELRLDAEKTGAEKFNRTATVIDPVPAASPGAYVFTYHGHDDQGRQFRFYSVVSPRGVLSLYAESSSTTQARLAADFARVLAGLSPRAAQP